MEVFKKYNNYLKTRNSNQRVEISDINWFSYNDALDKIRPYHYRKCQILTKLFLLLNNRLKSKSNYIKSKKNNIIKNFIFKNKKFKDNNIVKCKKNNKRKNNKNISNKANANKAIAIKAIAK